MFKHILAILCLSVSATTYAANILKTDKFFTEQNYAKAKEGYMDAAQLGNPHAFYQLATMYQKGLGVEKSTFNALIFFGLAADYGFHNSQAILDKSFARISEKDKNAIQAVIDDFKKQYGKEVVKNKYFPEVITANLAKRVKFDGEDELQIKYHSEEYESEELGSGFENDTGSFDLETGEEEFDDLMFLMTTPKEPFLVLEHDIHWDGSVRNLYEIQKIGNAYNLINDFKLFPIQQPTFEDQPVEFASRTLLGAAIYSKFTMHDENEHLYNQIRKLVRKLKGSEDISGRYQYAMLLLNIPWVEQEEGEAEKLLLELAKQGHPSAMYEYGFKLYREQREIETAIHWISEASKYGLVRAEYRLGKILQTSPWVKRDDKKALFWFESAMKKDHGAAALRAIEIKVLSEDKSLHDIDTAFKYLKSIEEEYDRNPEYQYLFAMANRNLENRDFKLVISSLRRAISLGQLANWNVDEWQDLLTRLTTGNVYIHDDN